MDGARRFGGQARAAGRTARAVPDDAPDSAPSTWTLHLSDEMRRELGGALPEKRHVTLPKGRGYHSVRAGPPAGVTAR
jgi:hypothetical protein